jgi:hypothetical protein
VHLAIVVVSIYKAYTVHIRARAKKQKKNKTKMIDVYSVREYLQIYGGIEIIQKSSFLQIIHLIMDYFNIIMSLTSLNLYYI